MKLRTAQTLLLLISFPLHAEQSAKAVKAATNTLAIHLIAESVSRTAITDGTASPAGLKLESMPILSDKDFVAWNVTNHTFVITPAAAIRVGVNCIHRELPFVLLANGEPVYLGMFGTGLSSTSAAVPVILSDLVVAECFMGVTNVPGDVWRMMGRGAPGVTERLLSMTNATTNVTLQIDRGYPPPDGFRLGPDRRNDKRISVAVEQLFRNRSRKD